MLFQCTDGDTSCGEYFNCMDLMARKKLPCGSKSLECLDAALGDEEELRKDGEPG